MGVYDECDCLQSFASQREKTENHWSGSFSKKKGKILQNKEKEGREEWETVFIDLPTAG